MKAQSSIEFISLLSLALLGSAVLVAAVNARAYDFETASRYEEAERLAQSVAYRADYGYSENASVRVEFPPDLSQDYKVSIGSGVVNVSFDSRSVRFPTLYEGSAESFYPNSSQVLNFSGGGLVVE